MTQLSRRVVGVHPVTALTERASLFAALEAVHACHFRAIGDAERQAPLSAGLDAILDFAPTADGPADAGVPSLSFHAGRPLGVPGDVQLANDTHLDACLRGRGLTESSGSANALTVRDGDRVLATSRGLPLWLIDRSGRQAASGIAPEPIAAGEALRTQLCAGRFMSLLPLVHFIRQIEGDLAYTPPPLRALFTIDDPNLRRRSYGFLSFEAVAAHAERHGYHASFATVPLDFGVADAHARELFRSNPRRLSLAIHGNDHTHHELLKADSPTQSLRIAAQALQRAAAFEKSTGLSIERIMVPPHARCSTSGRRALLELGYEALLMHVPEQHSADPAAADGLLAGWEPAQMVPEEVPLIVRHQLPFADLSVSFDEVVLSAWLGLPIILSGHHWDFRDGLDRLGEIADRINGLGDVQWMSPQAISRSNYATRRQNGQLHLRLYAHKIELAAGEDAVLVPECRASQACALVGVTDGKAEAPGGRLLALQSRETLCPMQVAVGPTPIWAKLRRELTVARDQAYPMLASWRRVLTKRVEPRAGDPHASTHGQG